MVLTIFLADKVFPKENPHIYYTKSQGSAQRAHGRLFDSVTNLKAKYRRSKIFEPRARRSLEKTITSKATSTCSGRRASHFKDLIETDDADDLDTQEMLEWLKSNVDNYHKCVEKWEKTNKERLQRILSNEKQSYLQEFPCIQQSWGYTLVCT